MPGFRTIDFLLEASMVSRLMTRTVAWTVGYNLLISMITASRYGIFEFTFVKSVVSTELISAISFPMHSGYLSSSINDHVRTTRYCDDHLRPTRLEYVL